MRKIAVALVLFTLPLVPLSARRAGSCPGDSQHGAETYMRSYIDWAQLQEVAGTWYLLGQGWAVSNEKPFQLGLYIERNGDLLLFAGTSSSNQQLFAWERPDVTAITDSPNGWNWNVQKASDIQHANDPTKWVGVNIPPIDLTSFSSGWHDIYLIQQPVGDGDYRHLECSYGQREFYKP